MAGRSFDTPDSIPFRIPDEGLIRANDVSPKGPPSLNGGTGAMGSGNMNFLMPLLMMLMGQGGGSGGGGNLMSMLAPFLGMGGGGGTMQPGSPFGTPGGGPGSTMMPGVSAPEEQYFQYLSQALPNIMNGMKAGTIQPGQQLQNFQGPQAFGIPSGGF